MRKRRSPPWRDSVEGLRRSARQRLERSRALGVEGKSVEVGGADNPKCFKAEGQDLVRGWTFLAIIWAER
jgi:hypothetical protein